MQPLAQRANCRNAVGLTRFYGVTDLYPPDSPSSLTGQFSVYFYGLPQSQLEAFFPINLP